MEELKMNLLWKDNNDVELFSIDNKNNKLNAGVISLIESKDELHLSMSFTYHSVKSLEDLYTLLNSPLHFVIKLTKNKINLECSIIPIESSTTQAIATKVTVFKITNNQEKKEIFDFIIESRYILIGSKRKYILIRNIQLCVS